nr:uncharacterized protein LOC127329532 [Lolium perenne]
MAGSSGPLEQIQTRRDRRAHAVAVAHACSHAVAIFAAVADAQSRRAIAVAHAVASRSPLLRASATRPSFRPRPTSPSLAQARAPPGPLHRASTPARLFSARPRPIQPEPPLAPRTCGSTPNAPRPRASLPLISHRAAKPPPPSTARTSCASRARAPPASRRSAIAPQQPPLANRPCRSRASGGSRCSIHPAAGLVPTTCPPALAVHLRARQAQGHARPRLPARQATHRPAPTSRRPRLDFSRRARPALLCSLAQRKIRSDRISDRAVRSATGAQTAGPRILAFAVLWEGRGQRLSSDFALVRFHSLLQLVRAPSGQNRRQHLRQIAGAARPPLVSASSGGIPYLHLNCHLKLPQPIDGENRWRQ